MHRETVMQTSDPADNISESTQARESVEESDTSRCVHCAEADDLNIDLVFALRESELLERYAANKSEVYERHANERMKILHDMLSYAYALETQLSRERCQRRSLEQQNRHLSSVAHEIASRTSDANHIASS